MYYLTVVPSPHQARQSDVENLMFSPFSFLLKQSSIE